MRWRDALTVLGLALAIAGAVVVQRARGREQAEFNRAAAELNRLALEISYRSVAGNAERNEFGWPLTIKPEWFMDEAGVGGAKQDAGAPRNTLAHADAPWIEIAEPQDRGLEHPRIRILVDENTAGFWYNPGTGVVRARVPVQLSDEASLALYNRLNGCDLSSIFDTPAGDRLTQSALPQRTR